VLLSGGFRFLFCIITARLLKKRVKKIHSFAIGLDANAPDVMQQKSG
jgi:hypothetical protein